ncbi:GNAT family N-acetyltransferase [Rothia uropygialis]|uniref:GNAT family N-acetyltransferase n=1 Tax=Kocuria sp. 36 TaxID=1415402 RepID=UPI00101BB33C|nr:GNAT family N-acetyltransferase [Kocuria sp. 36]
MRADYRLIEDAPDLEDYVRLRAEAGLSPKTPEQAAPVLTGSWAWAHVRHVESDETVAMGRVLGDGGWYFHIADMATLPNHQGRGIGREVISSLIRRIRQHAPADPYITLMADEPGRALYYSMGFRDAMPHSMGMVIPRD